MIKKKTGKQYKNSPKLFNVESFHKRALREAFREAQGNIMRNEIKLFPLMDPLVDRIKS